MNLWPITIGARTSLLDTLTAAGRPAHLHRLEGDGVEDIAAWLNDDNVRTGT